MAREAKAKRSDMFGYSPARRRASERGRHRNASRWTDRTRRNSPSPRSRVGAGRRRSLERCGAVRRRIFRRGVRSRDPGEQTHEFAGIGVAAFLLASATMNIRTLLPILGSAFLVLGTAGCPKNSTPAEGPAERAGKSVDNAAEKTKEGAKEAGQKTENTAHDVKQDVKRDTK